MRPIRLRWSVQSQLALFVGCGLGMLLAAHVIEYLQVRQRGRAFYMVKQGDDVEALRIHSDSPPTPVERLLGAEDHFELRFLRGDLTTLDDLAPVAAFGELQGLRIRHTRLDSTDAQLLSRLRWLRSLTIEAPLLDDRFAQVIRSLRNLEQLDLSQTGCGDAVAAACGELPYLRYVAVGHTTTDQGLRALLKSRSVAVVNAANTRVGRGAIVDGASPAPLTHLILRRCQLSAATLDSLAKFDKLASLDVRFCNFDSDPIPAMLKLTTLNELRFDGLRFEEAQLVQLFETLELNTISRFCNNIGGYPGPAGRSGNYYVENVWPHFVGWGGPETTLIRECHQAIEERFAASRSNANAR